MAEVWNGYAPSMSPGQVGVGGFVAPTSDDPNTALGQQSGTPTFAQGLVGLGTALKGLTSGLPGAGGSTGGAGLSNQAGNVQMPNISGSIVHPGQAAMGQSRSPTSLDSLLQLLMARRNAYLAATNPQGAKPVDTALPSGKGLLGI
jgi:hypothetical protein